MKPFLIVNIVEGSLGAIKERTTWEDALEIATEMAAEQCDSPKDEIREELERDSDFRSPNGGSIRVYIAQAED